MRGVRCDLGKDVALTKDVTRDFRVVGVVGGSSHIDSLDHGAIACKEPVVVSQRVGVDFIVVAYERMGSRPRRRSNRRILRCTQLHSAAGEFDSLEGGEGAAFAAVEANC